MPLFMLMPLAVIAFAIIVVGYLLSSQQKTQVRRKQTEYPESYSVDRVIRRASRPVMRQPLLRQSVQVRQVVEYSEQRTWPVLWQSLSVNRIFKRRRGEPTPWLGIFLILVSCYLLFIFLLRMVMPNATLIGAFSWPTTQSSNSSSQQTSPQIPYAASAALARLSQLDPNQYSSNSEYNTWAYSACSAAAFTEVINSYGHRYRITDILKVESSIGEITPQLGLTEDIGVARTMTRFNFKTTWGYNLSLNAIIDIANHGRPVIVSWPPAKYDGGHIVVVTGGDANNVFLADSSIFNRHSLTYGQFNHWWAGFYAVPTPS